MAQRPSDLFGGGQMNIRLFARYARLWYKLTAHSFLTALSTRFGAVLFLTGKIFRFVFFLVFLLTLFGRTQFLANYTVTQTVFFFLTFNFIDTFVQLLFREVYRFRPMIVSGDFDLVLVKPMNPLFRALVGGADPLDLFMLIPYTGSLVYVGGQLEASVAGIILYILLLVNAVVIAAGFHIMVLALAILTTEIDHTIMIYRDVTSMGRVPVDIYHEPLRSVITFIVPVGVMMTFPVKALIGLLSPVITVLTFVLGLGFLILGKRLWAFALVRYASASS